MQIIHDKYELVHLPFSFLFCTRKFNQQNKWTLKLIVGKNFKVTKLFICSMIRFNDPFTSNASAEIICTLIEH